MTVRLSPLLLRIVAVLLFGVLMALRTEVANRWVGSLLAGAAFGTLAMVWRLPQRPVRFSLRFFRAKIAPANRR